MIITKLIGGLGNQLFQYATARRLAHVHDASLRLDTRAFGTYRLHSFGLNHFNISGEIASDEDLKSIGRIYSNPLAYRLVKRTIKGLGIFHFGNLAIENFLAFNPKVLSLPDNSYLDGYWTSERYFKDIDNILRRELTLKEEIGTVSQIIKKRIVSSNAISVHVRRGDYATNAITNSIHGVLPLEYYNKAIKLIEEKVRDPHFFIFSDDLGWVREKFNISSVHTFVEGNGPERNYEDLYLMSLCGHNIIANSTFSWWGAWLNNNLSKIVIAPQKWFSSIRAETSDFIPKDWLSI